ncbi:hypothetical protein [Azonexus sp. IMCC34839]|uniref:hypothetical protein n=1 Tax=Azonexus sp. IMCC34839 TaxID=3133695 RepID=UPI003999B5CD
MSAIAINMFVVIAAIIIIYRTEPVLNRMSRCTPFMVRAAFYLLSIGAACQIVSVVTGESTSISSAIMTGGVAALLVCERRLRVLCPAQRKGRA